MAETISTINKPGEDYDTLALWQSDKAGDITAGNAEVAECYDDDGILAAGCNIDGWVTDADSYVKVYAPSSERHNGVAGTGCRIGSASWADVFEIEEAYVRIEGLEMYFTADRNSSGVNLRYNAKIQILFNCCK